MSDDECAFDNWQEAAEELQKEQLEQKQEQTQSQEQQQANQISDAINQQQKAQKAPLDPKEILRKKIKLYQDMTLEEFEAAEDEINENNKTAGKKVGNPVLKSDKDFNNYARTLAKRFDSMVQNEQATIDDEKLSLFFEELTLYMYKNLEWKSLHEVQAKLRVLKKERKADEDKRRKQKEKEERTKKLQGEGSQDKSQSNALSKKQHKQEDDLFGGATTMNSKVEEDERKNKIIVEDVKKEEKKEESDDDDFM